MQSYLIYENGNFVESIIAENPEFVFKKIDELYLQKGINWRKDLLIRIYEEEIKTIHNEIGIVITRITNNGKRINLSKSKHWNINLVICSKQIGADIYDNTDITIYVLWESIKKNIEADLDKEILISKYSINFLIGNTVFKNNFSQKAKLVLFFSKKGNYGRMWKYQEAREAMEKEGLAMVGRGIEGERPREFRYAMGYSFITNEKDKNVPDGCFIVKSPLPFGPRNERRNATTHLEKSDWSDLISILEKNPKRLRCEACGLFEEEINKIGQKTKFQKGHYLSHLSGGNVSGTNIFSICQYCNTEQLNLYDMDPVTGKKKWNLIPVISKRDYKTKLEIFDYLKEHLNKKDLN